MIVTATNYSKDRFDQLKVLLHSLHLHDSKTIVRVHLVDFPFCPKLEIINPFCEVFMEDEHLSEKKDIRGFMVCYRSRVLVKAMKSYREPVAWFDTDILVRSSLNDLWRDVEPNSLKIMRRKTGRRDLQFQAGIFVVGNSPETFQMIECFDRQLRSSFKWYEDQKILFCEYEKNKDKIKHIQLDKKYNDWEFDDKSIMWHAKSSHFKEEKFQKEFQCILLKANDLMSQQ